MDDLNVNSVQSGKNTNLYGPYDSFWVNKLNVTTFKKVLLYWVKGMLGVNEI